MLTTNLPSYGCYVRADFHFGQIYGKYKFSIWAQLELSMMALVTKTVTTRVFTSSGRGTIGRKSLWET